jgi:hypothetical protein
MNLSLVKKYAEVGHKSASFGKPVIGR